MKKLALLLVFILLMGCAQADVNLVKTFTDVDWINGTNLLRVNGENGYYIADIDGNALSEDIFSNSFSCTNGIVTAYIRDDGFNTQGALHTDGSAAIPFQYGDIKVLSNEWAIGYVLTEATSDNFDYKSWSGNSYYLIDYVDIYNLVSGASLSLPRTNFLSASATGHSLNIEDRASGKVSAYDANFALLGTDLSSVYSDVYGMYDVVDFYEDGLYGLMDGNGNVILPPTYDTIYSFYGDYAKVEMNGKYGVIDRSGALIIPAEYDDFDTSFYLPESENGGSSLSAGGYFCMEKDGKLGYVNQDGVSCEPKYSVDIMENNGASASFTDLEGVFNIMAADGVITPITGYGSVNCLYYGGGFYYSVYDADYNEGLIDWHGNVIFPCEYTDITLSGDGRYLLAQIDYETVEMYTLDNPSL